MVVFSQLRSQLIVGGGGGGRRMSVTELKERHAAATETVNTLRERLKQRRRSLLDTDGVPKFLCSFFFFNIYLIQFLQCFLVCVYFLCVSQIWLVFVWNLYSCRVRQVAESDSGQFRTNGSGLLQNTSGSYRQGIHRRIRINLCIGCIIELLEMVIKLLGFVWDFQIRGLCRKLRMK